MWRLIGCALALSLVGCGCTANSKAKLQAQSAFQAGQLQALQSQTGAQPAPMVSFRGEVQNRQVVWSEGLTLANALVAAQYTGLWDPRDIFITRRGQRYRIDPKALLRGEEDPLLEPGDIVDIRR
jgi:hypothetical protein